MKNLGFIAFLVLAAAVYIGIHFSFERSSVLRVGIECDNPPNNWLEDRETDSNVPVANLEDRYAEGYDIQIAKIVADSMRAKLEVHKIDWNELIPALERHEIDAIFSSMLDTEERKKIIAFSDAYEDRITEYVVVVHRDEKYSEAQKITDFAGAKFIGQNGTLSDRLIAQIPNAVHLAGVDSMNEMLTKFRKREADCIILSMESFNMYRQTYPKAKVVRFSQGEGFSFDYTGVCAGVRKDNAHLLNSINRALRDISKHDRQRIMDRSIAREWDNF